MRAVACRTCSDVTVMAPVIAQGGPVIDQALLAVHQPLHLAQVLVPHPWRYSGPLQSENPADVSVAVWSTPAAEDAWVMRLGVTFHDLNPLYDRTV